ncbi:MAG: DUF4381 family protein [Oleiphilaceae bacterium]|nr:DUF4381 family protein [Oleiphilaceae bacterium]
MTDALQETLNKLHDVQPPPPVSHWPPAPGWWWLGALCLLLLLGLCWWAWRRLGPRLRRRRLMASLPAPCHDGRDFTRINAWLKFAAGQCYPAAGTAPMSGEPWLSFLRDRAPGLPQEQLQALLHSALTPQPRLTPEQARELAAEWLRRQPC